MVNIFDPETTKCNQSFLDKKIVKTMKKSEMKAGSPFEFFLKRYIFYSHKSIFRTISYFLFYVTFRTIQNRRCNQPAIKRKNREKFKTSKKRKNEKKAKTAHQKKFQREGKKFHKMTREELCLRAAVFFYLSDKEPSEKNKSVLFRCHLYLYKAQSTTFCLKSTLNYRKT